MKELKHTQSKWTLYSEEAQGVMEDFALIKSIICTPTKQN
jgi:hypothetical protein